MARPETFAALDLGKLARSLRRIEGRGVENGVERIWYQGGEPYFDVHLEVKGGELDWFQVTFRSHSVTWDRDDARVVTGRTTEGRVDDALHPGSKTVRNDPTVDAGLVAFARELLAVREDLAWFPAMASRLGA